MDTIKVHRKQGPALVFTFHKEITLKDCNVIVNTPGYYHQGRRRTFRIMFDDPSSSNSYCKPIWIALILAGNNQHVAACTYESELGATYVEFSYGRYYFGNPQTNDKETAANRKPSLLKRRTKQL